MEGHWVKYWKERPNCYKCEIKESIWNCHFLYSEMLPVRNLFEVEFINASTKLNKSTFWTLQTNLRIAHARISKEWLVLWIWSNCHLCWIFQSTNRNPRLPYQQHCFAASFLKKILISSYSIKVFDLIQCYLYPKIMNNW